MSVIDSFRIEGRHALVTGGAKGLGRVMAHALAEAGANVSVVSRTLTQCEQAAREIAAATGRSAAAFAADVSVSADVERAFRQASETQGPIDILVNSAGVNVRGLAHELAEADWDAVVDVNLKGTFLCSRAVMPSMAERGWGRIVNLGSILGAVALPGRAPYAAAKAGVANLTRVLALEVANRGVTVNAICPGPFATEMNLPILDDPEKYAAFIAKIPMGRWGELHEIAGTVVFLASDAASYVTGSCLYVDGGWTAQ